jgi:hypothetical protein
LGPRPALQILEGSRKGAAPEQSTVLRKERRAREVEERML